MLQSEERGLASTRNNAVAFTSAQQKGNLFRSDIKIKEGWGKGGRVIDHISERNGISLRLLARARTELFLSSREGSTSTRALNQTTPALLLSRSRRTRGGGRGRSASVAYSSHVAHEETSLSVSHVLRETLTLDRARKLVDQPRFATV